VIQYWLLAVAAFVCPGTLVYAPAMMLATWAVSGWLRKELEEKLDRNRLVSEGASDEKTVCESLDECQKICVGWSPFLPFLPLILLAAAIYVHRLDM